MPSLLKIGVFSAFLSLGVMTPVEKKPTVVRNLATEPLPVSQDSKDCRLDNNAFSVGEELTYKLYYNWNFVWMSAGEVTFRVKDNGSQYYYAINGSTYNSYDWFFKVRDKYDTYVNKETLLPEMSIRDVQEGGYRLYEKVKYEQAGGKAVSTRGRNKNETTTESFNIQPCMHDVVSIMYHLRNLDYSTMNKGQAVPINIFMDRETWPLKVRYQGKEVKNIKELGKYKTVKLTPDIIEGYVFKKDALLTIWAMDDENKVPLLIESPLSVGSVKAVLKSWRGLRHPIASKVQG